MTFKKIIAAIATVALVIFAVQQIYTYFHRPLVHRINEDIEVIGIIDMEKAGHITKASVLNGDNYLLVVDHSSSLYQKMQHKIPQLTYLTVDELFNVNNLHLFDHNSDGLLTKKDPLFEHLYVIRFYNDGQQDEIKTLTLAGIKAILINNSTPTGDHQVLLQDGSERALYSITKFEIHHELP